MLTRSGSKPFQNNREQFSQSTGSQNKVNPHWHNKEHNQDIVLIEFRIGKNISQRETDQKTEDSIEDSDEKRNQKNIELSSRSKEIDNGRHGEISVSITEGIENNKENRNQNEQKKKNNKRERKSFSEGFIFHSLQCLLVASERWSSCRY